MRLLLRGVCAVTQLTQGGEHYLLFTDDDLRLILPRQRLHKYYSLELLSL